VRIGIVGLPNAGKTTLFNALTRRGAQVGNYPFTTIEPNIAVAPVPDARLGEIARVVGSSEEVPETIDFADIAGLVKGASQGEGLGNQFLGAIRETDAICHVVRCHADANVVHPDGNVDPLRDIETIETELLLADLDQATGRLERVEKQAKRGDPAVIAEAQWLGEVVDALGEGRAVRTVPAEGAAREAPTRLHALTSKPILYVANVEEADAQDEVPAVVAEHARSVGAEAVALSAKIENELSELGTEEAAEMRAEYGLSESGLERLTLAAYSLLGLITFYTAGEGKEAMARSLRRGSSALEAAAVVHTEIADAFVKAEVIAYDDLIASGGYAGARDRGLLRIEGRDYIVRDGDVITIRN
jgi:GTP-binding protein YchF